MTTKISTSGLLRDEHAQLLDVTDSLRGIGLARHMPLPQLVVCGDQSSGKSSVLQSISGVKFPVNDGLCTRFATKVILRRSETKSGSVSIEPGSSSSEEQRQKLNAFKAVDADFENIPVYMQKAQAIMGLAGDSTFSDATLRVELSGPDQPHLTLVDLPGLIHARDKFQSEKDVEMVKIMVRKYMEKERTIILAILSAKSDPGTQAILEMAREVDPTGSRTLGIITKPDMLHPGSPTERKVLSYARNEQTYFGLGWHVVRNPDFKECADPTFDRQRKEHDLFSTAPWNGLPETSLGAEALIARLGECSFNLTRTELPNVVREIQSKITDCQSRLDLLGPARDSAGDQRLYLIRIAQKFQRIVLDGVEGQFGRDTYFSNPSRRLCAEVRKLTDAFAYSIRRYGRTYKINGYDDSTSGVDADLDLPAYTFTDEEPKDIEWHVYLEMICKEILEVNRGPELPTTFDPLLVREVFRRQSRKWEGIALDYADKVFSTAKTFIKEVLEKNTEREAYQRLSEEFLEPAMSLKQDVLHGKVKELLTPYTRSHPFSQNPRFIQELKDIELEIHKQYPTWENQERAATGYACTKLAWWEYAYYKIALNTFIDNMAILAIENCVLADLHELLSPSKIAAVDDEVLGRLASESTKTIEDRASTNRDLAIFQKALRICRDCRVGTTAHVRPRSVHPSTSTEYQPAVSEPQHPGVGELASAMTHISLTTPAIRLTANDSFDMGLAPAASRLNQRPDEYAGQIDDDRQAHSGSRTSVASNISAHEERYSYSRTPSPAHSPNASLSSAKSSSSVSTPNSSPMPRKGNPSSTHVRT